MNVYVSQNQFQSKIQQIKKWRQNMSKPTATDVFVQTGYPKYTYVIRDEVDINMRNAIKDRGIHIYLYGNSKSGKTSLWKKYLELGDYIEPIRLNDKTTIESLYNDILYKTESYYTSEIHKSKEHSNSLKGNVKDMFTGSSLEVERMEKSIKTIREQKVGELKYNINLLVECLKVKKPRIILEDFHFADDKLILEFAKDLKSLSDEEIQVILVGVENKAEVLRRGTPQRDLEGKILEIEVGYFENKYLEKIIEQGSVVLNFEVVDNLKKMIASESFNRAYLTQNICQIICDIQGITESCTKHYTFDKEDVVSKSCRMIAHKYKRWESVVDYFGTRKHGKDQFRPYRWILKLIQTTKISTDGISLQNVVHRIHEIGGKNVPDPSIRSSVVNIPKLLSKNDLEPVIRYENSKLYVDEMFQFFVRWSNEILDQYTEDI